MYCPVNKNVIAIVPQIATGNGPAASCSSPASTTSNVGAQSFSSVLEQAKPSANDSFGVEASSTQAAGQGSSSPVNAPSKKDAKPSDSKSSDSKTNDSQDRGNVPAQAPNQTVPVVLVQPQLTPALCWSLGIKDLVSNTDVGSATLNDKKTTASLFEMGSTARPEAAGQSTSPIKSGENTNGQALPNLANAEPAKADATRGQSVAALIANLSGAAGADTKTQPGNGPVTAAHNVAHNTTEAVNQAQAVVKSEIEQISVPPSIASPIPSTPAPGQLETGSLQGTSTKLGPDRSGISTSQDSSGTTRKSGDVLGTTKSQSRKDDTSSSFSSPGDDAGPVNVPAKTSDPSSAFSVAGIQSSTAANGDKSLTPSVPSGSSAQQSAQLDQKSTGVVQTPGQAEAYPTSLVHSAKLVERIGEAELRLGIRAGEFGSVDIRTSMVRNQFTAEISTERGELGRAMAAELPSLQNRLNEQRVPVGNITLQNHAGGQSPAFEQQQKPRDGQALYATNSGSGAEKSPVPALVAMEATVPASRLDIHM
jgi:flagellar hook-length control protein FliK